MGRDRPPLLQGAESAVSLGQILSWWKSIQPRGQPGGSAEALPCHAGALRAVADSEWECGGAAVEHSEK